LAWAKVKILVRANNITGEWSLQFPTDLTKSAVASVTKEDWAGYSKHVQMLEQQYCKRMDVIDNIIISLGSTDSNRSESSIDSSSGDNDSDLTDTSELAQPLAE
jgi:hypothetical protein